MKKHIPIILTLVAAVVVFAIIRFTAPETVSPGTTPQPQLAASDFKGARLSAKEEEIPVIYRSVGTIHSRDEIEISSRITARIVDIKPRSGDQVEKDAPIAELDSSELKANAEEASARMDAASAQMKTIEESINSAKAGLKLSDSEFSRVKGLFEKGVVPQKQYDQADSALKQAQATYNQALERYKGAKSDYSAAEQSMRYYESILSYASLKSPLAGVVSERFADPGDMAAPGKILIKIFDPKRLMLEVPIKESLAGKIQVGDKIPFRVEAAGKDYSGEIKEISPSVDPSNRTFIVKICIGEAKELTPGMFGTASVRTGTEKAVVVPAKAVTSIGQMQYVLLEKGDKVEKVPVRTATMEDGRLKILSGLKPGETVVVPE